MSCSYMIHKGSGRRFSGVKEAREQDIMNGDYIVIRDFTKLLPKESWSYHGEHGKWQAVDYKLDSGEAGTMMMVNQRDMAEPGLNVPPEIKIPLFLQGWYAIWVGIPFIELEPRALPTGIDAALDCDCYVHLWPERGIRHGRIMGNTGCEVLKFLTCGKLDARSLCLRLPNGTYSPYPLGLCRALVASIHLVKLSEDQIKDWEFECKRTDTKRIINICDGFSHYWQGSSFNMVDSRFAAAHRNSDAGILMMQTPCTGIGSYPSQCLEMPGEGFGEEHWKELRFGDRIVHEYLKWAGANGCEAFAILPGLCRRWGMKCFMSLRTNLFFEDEGKFGSFGAYINGTFWKQHPELRKPGSVQLDYSKPEARQFIYAIIREVFSNYSLDGFHYDWTRWPPVFDPKRHDEEVPLLMLRETRSLLDELEEKTKKRIELSISIVEGYHAKMTLAEQKLNVEKLLSCGVLDFICIEAWDHTEYVKLARKWGIKYYAVQDMEPIDVPLWQCDHPDWRPYPDQRPEDPVVGEERMEQIPLNGTLDPTEYETAADRYYTAGVDGIVIVNNFFGRCTGRLGHYDELKQRIAAGEVFGQIDGENIMIQKK